MSRSWFGGTTDDWVSTRYKFSARTTLAAFADNKRVTFWDAETGGNQHTDLLLAGITPTNSVTADEYGFLPRFQGPDPATTMWAETDDDQPRRLMVTTDFAVAAAEDLANKIDVVEKGALNGVATLSGTGKLEQPLPAAQIEGPIDEADLPDLSATYATTGTAQTVTGIKTHRVGIVIDNDADADFLDAIVLKAGKSAQHKRYFDFRGIDNVTKWRMGVNAGNQFILYDNQSDGTHVFDANPEASGGMVRINAQGSGAINFNHEANSSNGGVHVYSGGAAPTRWIAIDGTGFRIFSAGTERMRFTQSGNVGVRTTDHGGAVGSIALANAVTLPTANPVGGGVMYSEGGALKWRGSSGTVTTIAPA